MSVNMKVSRPGMRQMSRTCARAGYVRDISRKVLATKFHDQVRGGLKREVRMVVRARLVQSC